MKSTKSILGSPRFNGITNDSSLNQSKVRSFHNMQLAVSWAIIRDQLLWDPWKWIMKEESRKHALPAQDMNAFAILPKLLF